MRGNAPWNKVLGSRKDEDKMKVCLLKKHISRCCSRNQRDKARSQSKQNLSNE
jgi:hypothetical protein